MDATPGFFVGALCSLCIIWQDFRDREIHVFALGCFGISGMFFQYAHCQWAFLPDLLTNCLMISFVLGFIWLMYRMRGESQFMDVKLGWGDVVMFLALSFWLEPLHFIVLYSTTTSLLSVGCTILRFFRRLDPAYPIPLAGFLALGFLLYAPWLFFFF